MMTSKRQHQHQQRQQQRQRISIIEFLRSGRLSDGVVLLQDEESFTADNGGGITALVGSSNQQRSGQQQQIENAARLAFLLSRSFVQFCQLSEASNRKDVDLSSMQLDNFFVNFYLDNNSNANNISESATKSQAGATHQDSDTQQQYSLGFFSNFDGKDDAYQDYFISQAKKEEPCLAPSKIGVKDVNGAQMGMGYFSTFSETVLTNSNAQKKDEKIPASASQTLQSNSVATNQQNQGPSSKGFSKCIITGIDITSPPRRVNQLQPQHPYSRKLAIQILGAMLYSIFSQGGSLPLSVLSQEKTSQDEQRSNDESSNEERSQKRGRTSESTVFSRLVDGKLFPISICRLISDMIADVSITKFDDILQDLEQMISQPSIFLHDEACNALRGKPQPPLFGQSMHGREKEISQMMYATVRMEQSIREPSAEHVKLGVEAVFVSGVAGSGKTLCAQAVEEKLLGHNKNWVVIKAKFELGAEHTSRGVVSSMFDQVISHLVELRNSNNASDVEYVQRASQTILSRVGSQNLLSLIGFLPSLCPLFGCSNNDGGGKAGTTMQMNLEWQLINSLSSILEAVLEPDRFIMICCDDMQCADRTSLTLICEILIVLGGTKSLASRQCLFLGLYRSDEIHDSHPFSAQYSYLRRSSNINITEVKLSSFEVSTVCEMISEGLRLTRRSVQELAEVVHKKTSGSPFFIVQLLTSLFRDSIVMFSTDKLRYVWDQDTINFIPTADGVAGLIASNIKSLSDAQQNTLAILSCFGIQCEVSLIQCLESTFAMGMVSMLDGLVKHGILDLAAGIIIFCHDLIQQAVYRTINEADRKILHRKIGDCLGSQHETFSILTQINAATVSTEPSSFFTGRNTLTSTLISLACDQINLSGVEDIQDEKQKIKYAKWNLHAGLMMVSESNFLQAQYYYTHGIRCFGNDCWRSNPLHYKVWLELHEGAVLTSYSLGCADKAVEYAEELINNASTLNDTLVVEQYMLKSLAQMMKFEECIARGTNILSRLNVNIPASPSLQTILDAIATTEVIISQSSAEKIIELCDKSVDNWVLSVIKIMDSFYAACYASASPFLPLIACTLVQFSLQHGLCQEAAMSFGTVGMYKIFLEKDYVGGRRWAQIARAITTKHQSMKDGKMLTNFPQRCYILLYMTIDIFFEAPRTIAMKLIAYHKDALRAGHMDYAAFSLNTGFRYNLFGGEKLSLLTKSFDDHIRLIAKHSKHATTYMILDGVLLKSLTGQAEDSLSIIEGSICNITDIQAEAESSQDKRLLYNIHVYNCFISYWKGDYMVAEKYSNTAWKMQPVSKLPTLFLLYHTFFRGLVLFHLFRREGGDDTRLKEGREMMDEMGIWAKNAMSVFENKWLLLQAEHAASIKKHDEAQNFYKAAIKVAQDHGNIHELGLAYHLLGLHYLEIECNTESRECLTKANTYYTQWGATAVASKLLHEHNLQVNSVK